MPRTIALIYFVIGALWVFLTDRLLLWLHLDPQRVMRLESYKGWLFVAGSALLLYVLLRRYRRDEEKTLAALIASQREVREANLQLEQRVAARTRQLETANRELESFAYAVSHDLRAPLRGMSGFSQILLEAAPPGLDERSRNYLQRIHDASARMSRLVDDLLNLSRIGRSQLKLRPVSLTQVAMEAAASVRERYPNRTVQLDIAPDMNVTADERLLRIVMENLLSNAWKYTAPVAQARIKVGVEQRTDGAVYFVRDNGVGFDMAYAGKLFTAFQRLHTEAEFPGSGIGLVTAQRILARHGGQIWADAKPNEGATFFFTLGRQDA